MTKKERRKLKQFGLEELKHLTDEERYDFAKYLLENRFKTAKKKDRKQIALTILKSK